MLYRAEGRAKEGKQGKTWREGERVMKRSDRRGGENRPGLGADFNLVITRTNVLLVWAAISHLFLYYRNLPFTLHLDKVHRVSITVLAKRLISTIFHFLMTLCRARLFVSISGDLLLIALLIFMRYTRVGTVSLYACVCEFVFACVNVCALTQFSAVPQCLTCLSLVYLPFGSV